MDFLHLGVAQMSHVIIKFNLNLAHLAHEHTHNEVPQHHTLFRILWWCRLLGGISTS